MVVPTRAMVSTKRDPRASRMAATGLLTLALALSVSALALGQPQTAGWQVEVAEAALTGDSGVLETRYLRGGVPATDPIRVHRYRVHRVAEPSFATLLYLPGTNMNGAAAVLDERHNLWLYLARRGVDVFTLDYRSHFVGNDVLADSAVLAGWGLPEYVADASAAAELALAEGGRSTLFVAGFSRGVTLAYGLAATFPETKLAGLIVLDGSFKSHDRKAAFDLEGAIAALRKSGKFASDVSGNLGWQQRDRLMSAAATNPEAPAIDSDQPSVGAQVADILYRAWGNGGLTDPIGGVSRVEVLARLLAGYDRYYPTIQTPQGASIADYDDDPATGLDDRWGEQRTPILYFGATGLGPRWILDGIYSAAHSGTSDIELHVLEGYGHLDVLVGERAADEVFAPLVAWVRARAVGTRP